MLLTISTTHNPATELGYLLHKHPDRFQSFNLSFGKAHVFYPEVTVNRCSASLLLDVDPVGMVRGKNRNQSFLLGHYVNDRPYVASSFMSVAISQVYGTALGGRCKDRPELVATPITECDSFRSGRRMRTSEVPPKWQSSSIDFAALRLCARRCSGNLAQSRQDAKKGRTMNENEVAKIVVDACFQIHTRLGPGLLESVYEAVLEYELKKRGLRVERQVGIPVVYDDIRFDEGFRADLIVEGKVILELKSVEKTAPVHRKQVLTYLKLTNLRLGLLINFGSPLIKDGITRLVNRLEE